MPKICRESRICFRVFWNSDVKYHLTYTVPHIPSMNRCRTHYARVAPARRQGTSTMEMARMRRACLASAVRAASARNCEILRSWRVISIADMLPAPRINDMLYRVTFAAGRESTRSQVLGRLGSVSV